MASIEILSATAVMDGTVSVVDNDSISGLVEVVAVHNVLPLSSSVLIGSDIVDGS